MNDLRSRLAAADPAVAAQPDSELLETIIAGGTRRRRRWAVPALAAAAAAAVLLAPVLPFDGPPSASAEAVTVLDDAIDAITTTDPIPAPGDYWYIRTEGASWAMTGEVEAGQEGYQPPPGTYLVQTQRQQWVPASGLGTTFVAESSEYVEQLDGSPMPAGDYPVQTSDVWGATIDADHAGTWQAPTAEWLAALPRDPQQLRDRLYTESNGTDASAFQYTVDVLRSGLVPTDLRIALYRVLQTIPGVAVTARQAEVDGVTGVAVGRPEPGDGSHQEIVIDPADGDLIGTRGALPGLPMTATTVERTLVVGVPDTIRQQAVVFSAHGAELP